MKQIYIHIGLHKTGSTYIQKVLAENRDALQAAGLHYPTLGAEFLFGHHNFAWSYIPGRGSQGTETFSRDEFLTALSEVSAEKALISSEDFEFLTASQIVQLRDSLSGYDVRIVMYVRDPVGALYSRWQESVKHGDLTSLRTYYEKILSNPAPLNYARVAAAWAAAFGAEAMNIVLYDNLVAKQSDITLYLLNEVIELPIERHRLSMPPERVNMATSMGVIEVLRQLNQIHREMGDRDNLVRPFMKFIRRHAKGAKLKQCLQTLCDTEAEFVDLTELNQIFAEIAQQFLNKYIQHIHNPYSAQQLFIPASNKSLSVLDSQRVAKQIDLQGLYKLLTKEPAYSR